MPEKRWKRKDLLIGTMLSLILVLPAVIWIFIDVTPFGGDPSQYGSASLDLYRSWPSPFLWMKTMLSSMGFKAPGIAWLGQFFVPIGLLLGSVNDALLLSVVATQAIALLLVFRILWTFSQGGIVLSLAVCLFIAIGPLFQYLSHVFLVESLQLLTVVWFILIMSRANRWNRAFTLAQLTIASFVAMLAKTITPIYCFLPALVSLGFVFGAGPKKLPWGWKLRSTWFAWLVAVILGAGTILWYCHNYSAVVHHVAIASTGPIAELWGKKDTFLNTFVYWLDATRRLFFLWPSLVLGAILVVSGLVCYLQKPDKRQKYFTICCVISLIQIILTLAAFSFGSNRVTRYLLPLSPYFAILVGWGLSNIGKNMVKIAAASILAVMWAVSASIGLHVVDFNPSAFGMVPRMDAGTEKASAMREIIARTCNDKNQTPYTNIIAVDPPLKGDWLAPASANYAAARENIQYRKSPPCSYGYIGNSFLGNDASYSWNNILTKRPRYIVTFDPEIYPPSEKTYNRALNAQNFGIIFKNLTTCGCYERLPPLSEDSGILIFRAIQPSNSVSPTQTAK